MPKILDLRKKSIKKPELLQKPREEVRVDKKNAQTPTQPKLTAQQARQGFPEQNLGGQEIINAEKLQISWEAPSFYYNPQKRYLSLVIVALLAGAVALIIFRYDTLTSVFLILSSLVLLLYSKQKPTISRITVGQSGILVDDIMYYYKDLKSFWIEYNPGGPKELSLESAKWYMPYVKVLLNDQNPIELRSLIVNFLPEKEHENALVDHIGRRLGL